MSFLGNAWGGLTCNLWGPPESKYAILWLILPFISATDQRELEKELSSAALVKCGHPSNHDKGLARIGLQERLC